jgi:ribosomal protein S18 acetylase RimI-like enzyme
MTPSFRLSSSDSEVATCARLMAASPPWRELYFSEKQCRENLSSPTLNLHLAELEGRLVGFVATRATGMEGEPLLEYICVAPHYRGRGIGTSMLEFVEKKLYPNADNIYLFVSDINPRAIALYERVGYEEVGKLANYNVWGQTEFIYRKFCRPRQERFQPEGTLTGEQNEGKITGAIDLNSGYAQISLPKKLIACVIDGTRAAMFEEGDYNVAKVLLQNAVGALLRLPHTLHGQVRSTFSGSIALDRVFAAVRKHAQSRRSPKTGLTAILPEPSIDLWQLLLRERFSREQHLDVQIKGVRPQESVGGGRVDQLIEELETQVRRTPNRQMLVILDSPSNPLGLVTSAEDLERLAAACGRVGAVLVVDHCFLLAGLHAPKALPSVFDISGEICDWVGIWDTGKSIALAGDKAGFIVPGNPSIAAVIDDALSVIQPDTYTARRSIEVFSRLLGSPDLACYLKFAGDLCRGNLDYLLSCVRSDWTIKIPEAGTFACVYFEKSDMGSDQIRKIWLDAGVNAAASRTFFRSNPNEGIPFLRVSLLREREFFKTAIDRLP